MGFLFLVAGFDALGFGFAGALVVFGTFAGGFVYRRVRSLVEKDTTGYTPVHNHPTPNQKCFQDRSLHLLTNSCLRGQEL